MKQGADHRHALRGDLRYYRHEGKLIITPSYTWSRTLTDTYERADSHLVRTVAGSFDGIGCIVAAILEWLSLEITLVIYTKQYAQDKGMDKDPIDRTLTTSIWTTSPADMVKGFEISVL